MKLYTKYLGLFFVIILSNALLIGQEIEIPRASPKASISQTIGVCKVTVDYGRPSAHGRSIIGGLVPYNVVWRAGANEATTIAFNYEVSVGGKAVLPGKYGLFMIPKKDKWLVILNKDWEQWGAYNYSKNDDVLRIEVIPQEGNYTELCTYTFTDLNKSKGVLNMQWENTIISVAIEADVDKQTLAAIEKGVSASRENWYTFSAAAQYHFYERKEPNKALEYINTAIALKAPNPAPWMLKSQILASQGKYKEAIKFAEEAIEVSKRHNFLFELEENEENIHKWKNQ